MSFNIQAYKKSRESIFSQIESRDSCKDGFIRDGVICTDQYGKEGVRILCILAESYGHDDPDIEELSRENDILGLLNPDGV